MPGFHYFPMDPVAMDVDLNANDVLDNYASQSKP